MTVYDVVDMEAQIKALAADNQRLSDMLRRLQWDSQAWDGGDWRAACLVCNALRDRGHAPDCQLAALLERCQPGLIAGQIPAPR